jgi:succinate dehydrogenase / fumarate reductase iron-sulfur subunit
VARNVRLKIKRSDGPNSPSRWEEFDVPWHPRMNVISALMEIRRNPVTASGAKVAPVAWESSCLEEVCGACTMVINGRVRQACSTLIDRLGREDEPVTIQPMTKFPVVRDLIVDRSRMFEDLKKVKAWIKLDGTHELGPGPRQSQQAQEEAYPLSRCMTCGCCLEACPQINDSSSFIGAAAINQVRLFSIHPSGKMHAAERLEALMDGDALTGCGKAQNCADVCPKEIPLVDSISVVQRQASKHLLFGWLLK